jgi:hypothetical protein
VASEEAIDAGVGARREKCGGNISTDGDSKGVGGTEMISGTAGPGEGAFEGRLEAAMGGREEDGCWETVG